MSRFGYDDGSGEETWGLWEGALKQAVNGKRGQQALRDLEAALLALPEKRLIMGHLALNGEVCAVGALALHRRVQGGESRDSVLADLEARDEGWHGPTIEAGQQVGCTYTLTYTIGDLNDEVLWKATPEQRYERVLAWTRERILAPASRSFTEEGAET